MTLRKQQIDFERTRESADESAGDSGSMEVSMKTDRDYMRCAFCSWKTKRFITTKEGVKKGGAGRLAHHVETAHHDEFMKIVEQSESEFPDWE